jgi:hypothetical protein
MARTGRVAFDSTPEQAMQASAIEAVHWKHRSQTRPSHPSDSSLIVRSRILLRHACNVRATETTSTCSFNKDSTTTCRHYTPIIILITFTRERPAGFRHASHNPRVGVSLCRRGPAIALNPAVFPHIRSYLTSIVVI